MKFITFLACILMTFSIWSVTSNAKLEDGVAGKTLDSNPNGQPTSADGGSVGPTYTGDPKCKDCQESFAQNHGCMTGYNSPECRHFFEKESSVGTPNKSNPLAQ